MSKELAATLSDTKPEDDSDNKDAGILNAFTTTVNPTDGIVEYVDEEEELVESKFEKMDDQMTSTQLMRNCTSFLRSMRRKMLKTLELKRLTLKSSNKRSSISVIIVELSIILDQIAISG